MSVTICLSSVGACFLLSITYVASLYIWSSSHPRDHPLTIKRRFFSVFIMMFISPMFLYILGSRELFQKATIWELLGFRIEGIFNASLIPLLLTMVLFLGPISMTQCSNFNSTEYMSNFTNLIWLRNHIVAPLSEEFTFRACMLPLLMQCFGNTASILICPLFFGVAHFHHMLERLKSGMDLKTAIIISLFQFLYTTLFGVYSAYLFVRTGHFAAPFIVHAFCNHMGFPNFQEALSYKSPKKERVCSLFLLGLLLWGLLLEPTTKPDLFSNHLYNLNKEEDIKS
uniref:CAAX prenyl protease 2 n=1 Tax=Xenopsylla cheopis TaxID=163159 RepID=A0A6M2DUH6_XENCH